MVHRNAFNVLLVACLHSTARSWHRLAQREGSSLPVPVPVPAQPAAAQPELTLFQIDREVQSAMFSSPEATAAPRAAMPTAFLPEALPLPVPAPVPVPAPLPATRAAALMPASAPDGAVVVVDEPPSRKAPPVQEESPVRSMKTLQSEMERLRQRMQRLRQQQSKRKEWVQRELLLDDGAFWRPHTSQLCDTSSRQENGYITVGKSRTKHVFYWLFESRKAPADDPLIIYLNGGPGCSSMFAIFRENGPCRVTKDGTSTYRNEYSWTEFANVLWIDQPIWVGFSYSDLPIRDHNEWDVQNDMYEFLQRWLRAHPRFQSHDFIIGGESYAGHYIPVIANRIFTANNALRPGDLRINLRGIAIGNGCSQPSVQVEYFTEFADVAYQQYGIKCFRDGDETAVNAQIDICVNLLRDCQRIPRGDDMTLCREAQRQCMLITMNTFMKGGRNIYDIRKPCSHHPFCYSFEDVTKYLRRPEVRRALGIPDHVAPWQVCNLRVNADFQADWSRDCIWQLQPLLDAGIPVLNYAGDADYICNWAGNKAAMEQLQWSGQQAFRTSPDEIWHDPKTKQALGEVRSALGLTNLRVYNSGHMVAMDKPAVASLMMETWLRTKDDRGKFGVPPSPMTDTESR